MCACVCACMIVSPCADSFVFVHRWGIIRAFKIGSSTFQSTQHPIQQHLPLYVYISMSIIHIMVPHQSDCGLSIWCKLALLIWSMCRQLLMDMLPYRRNARQGPRKTRMLAKGNVFVFAWMLVCLAPCLHGCLHGIRSLKVAYTCFTWVEQIDTIWSFVKLICWIVWCERTFIEK